MQVSAKEVVGLSEERGFDPEMMERTVRLLDILDTLASDDVIAPRIALKGGTALNAFFAPLPRLSVDIDINYVGEADRSRMLEDKPKFQERFLAIMDSKGYDVIRSASKGFGKWKFRYESAHGRAASLDVDINYNQRHPFFGIERGTSIPLGRHRAHEVPLVDVHEVVGGKLKALATRERGRDLFDALTIMEMPNLNWQKVKLAAMVFGAAEPKGDWREISSAKISGDKADVQSRLTGCLPSGYFDAFGGHESWMNGTIERCRRELAPVFEYAERERAFLDAFLDKGRIDASKLDADAATKEAVTADPKLNRLGNAIRAGRFQMLGIAALEQRRADRELQLFSAITSRTPYSKQIHRRLHVEVRGALEMAERRRGVYQEDADNLAEEIALARAESDLRVQTTKKMSGVLLNESKARYTGKPDLPRHRMEQFESICREGKEAMIKEGVTPTDLERIVARAVVATKGNRRHSCARRMEAALKCGKVRSADKIRAERRAILVEFSRPMGRLPKHKRVRLVKRMHESYSVVETLQICNDQGPLLDLLKNPADRSNVRENFRSLFEVSVPGPAPWAKTHEALANDMGISQSRAVRSAEQGGDRCADRS